MSGMFYILCYDTPSDKRRRKLHSMLKNYAVQVQKSVFETFLDGPRFDELLKKMRPLIDPAVDSVRIYSMSRAAQRRMHVFGFPGLLEDPNFFIVSDALHNFDDIPSESSADVDEAKDL